MYEKKKNIQDVNDDSALQQILKVEPKTYNYIDRTRGTSNVYGFIAQQIQEVIPEAVSLQRDVIPNIFSYGTCVGSNIISFKNTSNISIDIIDTVRIIDENGIDSNYRITSNLGNNYGNDAFMIDGNINTSNVFVYGTQVDDFHTVNKDYIFTLNVAATQDLYKIIRTQQILINNLTDRLNSLENILTSNIIN